MESHIEITDLYRDVLTELGLVSAEQVFADRRLRVWRDLEDRDNSTLDATLPDGRSIRLHVKRDKRKRREPMSLEAAGIRLLNAANILTAPLVAHGHVGDRTFVITENLDGYTSADRLLETDVPREPILRTMIDVAARLHNAGLHHRDLYANHFYLRPNGHSGYEVRLIDTARVRRLPRFFRQRWIVKDMAQLLFSVSPFIAGPELRDVLWADYLHRTMREQNLAFVRRVEAKADWIARHDRSLRTKKPTRNLRLADGN